MTRLITAPSVLSSDYTNKNINRDRSIDTARGFAILLMIQVHLFILVPYNGIINNLNSLMSPSSFFLIMAGLSYEFFFRSRSAKYSEQTIFIEIIYRALILVSVDMLILLIGSILWPSTYSFTIYWGVIQVIAFGYIFGYIFPRDFKSRIFLIIGLILLTLMFDFSNMLLPGLIYFQFGRLIYYMVSLEDNKKHLFIISSLLIICNISILYIFNINIFSGWIASHRWEFPTIIIITNNVFVLLTVIRGIIHKYPNISYFLNPIERMGKIAFTIYFAHIGLIFAISTLVLKFLPDIIIKSSFILQFFALILFVIFFSTLEKYWSNYDYIFGFEWLLRKGSKFLLRYTEKWFHKYIDVRCVKT